MTLTTAIVAAIVLLAVWLGFCLGWWACGVARRRPEHGDHEPIWQPRKSVYTPPSIVLKNVRSPGASPEFDYTTKALMLGETRVTFACAAHALSADGPCGQVKVERYLGRVAMPGLEEVIKFD